MFFKTVCGFLIVGLAGAAMATDSPIDKGSLFLDGSFYFESRSGKLWENSDEDGLTTFSIGNAGLSFAYFDVKPAVGYFVAPGVYIGAQFGYQKYSKGGDDSFHIIGFGPALGYYAKANSATEAKGSLYAYGRGYFNFTSAGDEDDDTDMSQFGANLGLLYMLSSAVGADFSFNFQNDTLKDSDGGPSVSGTTIKFGVGLSAFIY